MTVIVVGGVEGPSTLTNDYPDGSVTARMTRMRHTMLASGATQVTLHFAHWARYETRWLSGVAPTQDLTLTATVEVVGAGISSASRGTISAQQALTLSPGQTGTLTFTLPAAVAQGAYFYSNTYVTAPLSGGQCQIPRGSNLETGRDEGYETNGTDKTLAGSVTAAGGLANGYGPVRVDVVSSGPAARSYAIFGDSINQERTSKNCYLALAGGTTWPRVQVAVGGDRIADWKTSEGDKRRALTDGCDVAISAYGANDLDSGRTLAAEAQDFLDGWTLMSKGFTRAVWQATVTPHSTSTDGFNSTANQTPETNASRISGFNDWLRDGAPCSPVTLTYLAAGTSGALRAGTYGHPLVGHIEIADAVETARNSSKWQSSPSPFTVDGLHMTATGTSAAAAAVDLTGTVMPSTYPSAPSSGGGGGTGGTPPLFPGGLVAVRYNGTVRSLVAVRYNGTVRSLVAIRRP